MCAGLSDTGALLSPDCGDWGSAGSESKLAMVIGTNGDNLPETNGTLLGIVAVFRLSLY